jgi:putative Mg2+ transporter-C (MgtC) family protein
MEQLLRDTTFTLSETVLRLGVATLCGFLLGLDRELRGISAGLRTHALVALSSAVITVSALELYGDTRAHGGDADPLRVIQGLAQAIGFIAAGAIFVSQGAVRNLTTAANIWLATAVGIAAGAVRARRRHHGLRRGHRDGRRLHRASRDEAAAGRRQGVRRRPRA